MAGGGGGGGTSPDYAPHASLESVSQAEPHFLICKMEMIAHRDFSRLKRDDGSKILTGTSQLLTA